MISVEQIYWLAGLIEGEGHFGLRRDGKDLNVAIASTDKDVIDKVVGILKFGSRRQKQLPSGKTDYRWLVSDQANAAGLMMTLLPLMGKRRSARIIECLDAWKAKPLRKALWTHCKNGHPLSGDNLKITHEGKYEKRRCVECGKLRQRKHRSKDPPNFVCT